MSLFKNLLIACATALFAAHCGVDFKESKIYNTQKDSLIQADATYKVVLKNPADFAKMMKVLGLVSHPNTAKIKALLNKNDKQYVYFKTSSTDAAKLQQFENILKREGLFSYISRIREQDLQTVIQHRHQSNYASTDNQDFFAMLATAADQLGMVDVRVTARKIVVKVLETFSVPEKETSFDFETFASEDGYEAVDKVSLGIEEKLLMSPEMLHMHDMLRRSLSEKFGPRMHLQILPK